MVRPFTFIDLFAGVGGFHHALAQLGGKCVLASEIDDDARKVYESSFPRVSGNNYEFVRNIRDLTRDDPADGESLKPAERVAALVPDHDLLCGGFPCQPFSKSGEQRGSRDQTRGTLFHDIIQIINAKRPKYIFLENVRNIAGPRHADTWNVVLSSIRDLGYFVPNEPLIFSPHLLPPTMGGAPQVRERVFILAVRESLGNDALRRLQQFNSDLRRKLFWSPERWRICDYLDADETINNVAEFTISEAETAYIRAWNYFVKGIQAERLPGFPLWAFAFSSRPNLKRGMPDWEVTFRKKNSDFYNDHRNFIDDWMRREWGKSKLTLAEFPISRQKFEWQAGTFHRVKRGRSLDDLVLQFRPSGIRVKPPTYLPALVAITQTPILGPRLRGAASRDFRRLTPQEAARLQSFPDSVYANMNVSISAAYKQLGNAVNVGLVKNVAALLLGSEYDRIRAAGVQHPLFT